MNCLFKFDCPNPVPQGGDLVQLELKAVAKQRERHQGFPVRRGLNHDFMQAQIVMASQGKSLRAIQLILFSTSAQAEACI
jgi:hypothetical protein